MHVLGPCNSAYALWHTKTYKPTHTSKFIHLLNVLQNVCCHVQKTCGDAKPKEDDGVKRYTEIVLSLGMFYWEYSDAICEGDGKRLLSWRYMLPLFINTGRTNYSLEAFYLLYQHDYQLPPRLAQQLLFSRFVNVHGTSGLNIAADLYMEHLNAVASL